MSLKIRMRVDLEVDPEVWALTYGVRGDKIPDDVESYVLGTIIGSAASDEGAITSVTTRLLH